MKKGLNLLLLEAEIIFGKIPNIIMSEIVNRGAVPSIQIKKESLEIVYSIGFVEPYDVWSIISSQISNLKLNDLGVKFYGKSLSLDDVSYEIVRSKKLHFNIKTEKARFQFTSIANYKHSLVVIEEIQDNSITWHEWIVDFLKLHGFVQAWVSDIEYSFWQSAEDPLEYEGSHRSYEGLPMRSNGLPYPLEKMVIDTSSNPARRDIKVGYVEAIGNPMWLGAQFWQYSSISKQCLIKELGEKAQEINGTVRIDMINGGFKDETSVKEQKKLRDLLYK